MQKNNTIYSLLWKRPEEYLFHALPEGGFFEKRNFTISIAFRLEKNDGEAVLYEQQDAWRLGIRNGGLFFRFYGETEINSEGSWFSGLKRQRFYRVSVCCSPDKISLWVDGCLVIEKSVQGEKVLAGTGGKPCCIGAGLSGQIKDLTVYPYCLTAEELRKDLFFRPDAEKAEIYFPFRGELTEQGKHRLATSVIGLPFLAGAVTAAEFDEDGYCYMGEESRRKTLFSLILPVCPKRSGQSIYTLIQRSAEDLSEGFCLFLRKKSDNRFAVCLTVYTEGNRQEYESKGMLSSDAWSLAGVIYDGSHFKTVEETSIHDTGMTGGFSEEKTWRCMLAAGFDAHSTLPVRNYTGSIYCAAEYSRLLAEDDVKEISAQYPNICDADIAAYYHASGNYIIEEVSQSRGQLLGTAGSVCAVAGNLEPQDRKAFQLPDQVPGEWELLSEMQKWRADWAGGMLRIFFDRCVPLEMRKVKEQWQRYLKVFFGGLLQGQFESLSNKFFLKGAAVNEASICEFIQKLLEEHRNGLFHAAVEAAYSAAENLPEAAELSFVADYLPDYLETSFSAPSGKSGFEDGWKEILPYTIQMMECRPAGMLPEGMHLRIASIRYAFPDRKGSGSLFIRKNGKECMEPPEWRKNSTAENPAYAAYIIGEADTPGIDVELEIRLDAGESHPLQIMISGEDLRQTTLGNVSTLCEISGKERKTINFLLDKDRLHNQKDISPGTGGWYWKISIGEEEYFLQNTYHKIYFFRNRPSEPWNGSPVDRYHPDHMMYPWTDVWDAVFPIVKNCETMEGIAHKIAEWLYGHPSFVYDMQEGKAHYTVGGKTFQMAKFLRDAAESGKKHLVNAEDVAMALASLTNLFGSYLRQMILLSPKAFACNQVVPLGAGKWVDFAYQGKEEGICSHCYAVTWPERDYVYDASICLDGGEYPQKKEDEAGAGKKKTAAIHMIPAESEEKEVNIRQPYTKMVYKERLLAQGQNYTETRIRTSWGIAPDGSST